MFRVEHIISLYINISDIVKKGVTKFKEIMIYKFILIYDTGDPIMVSCVKLNKNQLANPRNYASVIRSKKRLASTALQKNEEESLDKRLALSYKSTDLPVLRVNVPYQNDTFSIEHVKGCQTFVWCSM